METTEQRLAHKKGIFIQRNVEYNHSTKRTRGPFCVTFPRLANLGLDENSPIIYPSGDFSTYQSALNFALQYRRSDSRVSKCPIYFLENRWVGSSTRREIQRVG